MNLGEGKKFVVELITAFPTFESVAKESPDLGATHRSWVAAWDDLELLECQSVLSKLIKAGGISWEDYRAPGPFIRRLVIEARKEGAQSEADRAVGVDRERALARRRDYKGSPMAAALVKAIEMRAAGSGDDEVYSMIDASFPPAAEYDGPTYRCLLCRDRGLVQVVRVDTMRKVQRLELEASKVHCGLTYNVACTCSSGKTVQERKPMRQSGQLPVFYPQNFCRWHDDEGDSQRITSWLAEHKPKNFDTSFDTWNQTANN